MNGFISFSGSIRELLISIVQKPPLHAKWLNTLSYLENCGARKIAACEHPTLVRQEILKHAAEEFRHAHYLKSQIARVSSAALDSYILPSLLGKTTSFHYLNSLDLKTSRFLMRKYRSKEEIRHRAYLFVTYAIEKRAEELYPLYHEILRQFKSTVTVKSILLEEKEHLQEMEEQISKISLGFSEAEYVCSIESAFCKQWIDAVSREVFA